MKTWRADGVPRATPLLITETNYSANTTEHFQDISGALWFADFAGSFMSAGGSSLYLYEYEPDPLFDYSHCPVGWGSWGMWNATTHYTVKQPTSQYFAAQMLTQQWSDPVDQPHALYPATTDVVDGKHREIVTAYALERPDGQWAVMLVNKDPSHAYAVQVDFDTPERNGILFRLGQRDHPVTGAVRLETEQTQRHRQPRWAAGDGDPQRRFRRDVCAPRLVGRRVAWLDPDVAAAAHHARDAPDLGATKPAADRRLRPGRRRLLAVRWRPFDGGYEPAGG